MGPKKVKKKKKALFEDEDEEMEAKRRAEEERQKEERMRMELENELKMLRKEKKQKERRERFEDEVRRNVVERNCKFFNDFKVSRRNMAASERKNKEWADFASCRVQPLPYDPPSLNTYIYAFRNLQQAGRFENADAECEKLVEIMKMVDEYIDRPMCLKESTVKNLQEVKGTICDEILHTHDAATFRAIMNMEDHFSKVDVWKVELLRRSKMFLLWIWGWAVGGNVERKKKKVFKDAMPKRATEDFEVRLPRNLKYERLHLRIIRVSYDIFSWRSSTFSLPKYPAAHDFYQEILNKRERELKVLRDNAAKLCHEEMPWWYLDVYPPSVKIVKKEAKPLGKNLPPSVTTVVAEEEEFEDEEIFGDMSLWEKNRNVFKFDDLYLKHPTGEVEKDIPVTLKLYSIEMTNEMRDSKYRCEGEACYKEPDMMDYLGTEYAKLSCGSSSRKGEDLRQERMTTFRASFFSGDPNMPYAENASYLKAIHEALNPHNEETERPLRLTSKREFLDWRSWESLEYSAEKLEGMLYDFVYSRRETPKSRKTKLKQSDRTITKCRTVRDFLEAVTPKEIQESSGRVTSLLESISMCSGDYRTASRESKRSKRSTVLDLTNITTPTEFRGFETEIKNLLATAKEANAASYRSQLVPDLTGSGINLRETTVIGEVYLIDFIQDEPQPVTDSNNTTTQLHYGSYEIKKRPFFAVPEVHFDAALAAERQISSARYSVRASVKPKHTPAEEKEIELEDDETIHIKLKVYEKAVWFDPPRLLTWSEEIMSWTDSDVYDSDYKSNEGKIFFKLGKTSVPLALSSYRWHNLPYIKFKMEPSETWKSKPSVLLSILGKEVTFQFTIREEFITLDSLGRIDPKPVDHIIGVPYRMHELMTEMRRCNLDIFPDWDSFLYVNDSLRKCRPLEDYLYVCLAFVSSAYTIKNSLWNQMGDEDMIYFHMKRSCGRGAHASKCVLATPLRTCFVEKQPSTDIPIRPLDPQAKFEPDLKSLVEATCSKAVKNRISSTPSGLVANVYSMLLATKVLSFT